MIRHIRAKLLRFEVLCFVLLVVAAPACSQSPVPPPVEPGAEEIHTFEDCTQAGHPVLRSRPPKCATPDGRIFIQGRNPQPAPGQEAGCQNLCGNGRCEQIVCMAIGCPCPETPESCPEDCSSEFNTSW